MYTSRAEHVAKDLMPRDDLAETYLEVGILLQEDLLERVHIAQHARHCGEAILLQADCPEVGQPGQAHGQAVLADLVVSCLQYTEAGQPLHHSGH